MAKNAKLDSGTNMETKFSYVILSIFRIHIILFPECHSYEIRQISGYSEHSNDDKLVLTSSDMKSGKENWVLFSHSLWSLYFNNYC